MMSNLRPRKTTATQDEIDDYMRNRCFVSPQLYREPGWSTWGVTETGTIKVRTRLDSKQGESVEITKGNLMHMLRDLRKWERGF